MARLPFDLHLLATCRGILSLYEYDEHEVARLVLVLYIVLARINYNAYRKIYQQLATTTTLRSPTESST